jgi:hypothetical protein
LVRPSGSPRWVKGNEPLEQPKVFAKRSHLVSEMLMEASETYYNWPSNLWKQRKSGGQIWVRRVP